jgi:hypothetical protein
MACCEDCVYFDTKKQWCKLHDVPVVEENYCTKFKGRLNG